MHKASRNALKERAKQSVGRILIWLGIFLFHIVHSNAATPVGARIELGSIGAKVRASAGSATIYGTNNAYTLGTVLSGPVDAQISGSSDTTTYHWYQINYDGNAYDGWSADVGFTQPTPNAPIPLYPGYEASPGQIVGPSSVTFRWSPASIADANITTGYELYIHDIDAPNTTSYNTTSTNRTVQLTYSHRYYWVIYADNSDKYDPSPTVLYFQVAARPTLVGPGDTIQPGSTLSSLRPTLSWNALANAQGYNVYISQYPYGQANTFYSAQVSGGTTAFQIPANTPLPENTKCRWKVTALFNDALQSEVESDPSDALYFQTPVTPSIPNTPSSLSAVNSTNGIFLSWHDNATNETGFLVRRRRGVTTNFFSIGANQTNYLDTGVSQSLQYCYTVAATNGAGSSTQSAEQCATYIPPSDPPVAIIAGDLTPVTGTTTYYGKYSTGAGLQFAWATSNGQQSTLTNPPFTFNSPGNYGVQLIVTDSSQRHNTSSIPIVVQAFNNGSTPGIAIGADPVVLSTGNYIQSHADLQLPGKGFPFEFRRFYNSKFSDQTGRPLGFGWTFNYNMRVQDTGTNVLVTQGDGSTWTFFPTNNGYAAEPGIFDVLTHNPDNTWSLTNKSQAITSFGTNGQLASITDKNNNRLTCHYNAGVLSRIQDTAGRSIFFATNALGCFSEITDPIGRTIRFQYNSETNLTVVIDANNQTNSFFYNANHQITDGFDAKGTRFIHNDYNTNNFSVERQCDAFTNWTLFAYDFQNRVTWQTNALGKVSIYRFDDRLLVTNIVDEAGGQQAFAYDANRNRTLVLDKNGNPVHYDYDSRGNLTNKTDALNNVTSIEYDSRNNPTRRIDALNNFASFGYDERGNLTSTTNALLFVSRVQYDTNGLPIVLTDARGFSMTNSYDSQGNLTTVVDARGSVTRFDYDPAGRKTRQVDALGRTNSFALDNNDNLLSTTNALGFVNAFTYDGNNNPIASQNPRFAITTNVFDLKNRLIAALAPLSQTNGTLYDALDRKTRVTDALGNPTSFAYDNIGNLTAITNALNEVARFTFDPQGNTTSVIDPTGHYVTNIFDALHRKVATIDAGISTNLTQYDVLGRVTATTNANSQVTRLNYDAIGRLTNVVDAANQSVFFSYDQNGNRTRITDPNGNSWTNVFDELNHLIEQRDAQGHTTHLGYDPVGNLTNKVTPNGDSINYSFDALNRLTNIAYPTGIPVSIAYDSVGNRTNMTDGLGPTAWQYDLLNRLTSITDPFGQTVANGFDPNGNRVCLTYPGGNAVNYSFDVLNRIEGLTNWLGGVVRYAYDNRGNMTAATNANATTVSYAYDLASRLIAVTNSAPNASVIAAYGLTLDGLGNHQQSVQEQPLFPILTNQTNNYVYDSDNRLTAIDGQTVIHNPNGDLTAIGASTYGFDYEDRLTQFALTNTSGSCSYDGLGNRLTRTVNGDSRHFTLDRIGALTQVLVEADTNNIPIAFYIYGAGLAERITPGGKLSTYHFNLQGSTVALTDSGGNVTDSYAFDSFGVLANAEGDSPQPFRYLGQYGIINDSTGLLYARARYFSPQLGRFITKDPITGRDSDAQSLNRYVYALNSPLNLQDVSGLCAGNNSSQFIFTQSPATFFSIVGQDLLGIGDAVVDLANGAIALPRTIWYGWMNLPTTISEIAHNPGEVASAVFSHTVSQPLQDIWGAFASGNNREGTRLLAPLVASFMIGPEGGAAKGAIGATGKIGESALKALGGESQVYFRTSQGGRYVDQLVNGIANESKVGYQSLTPSISSQIAKDAELINSGQIQGATWNFFQSPVTGLGGPSQPLFNALQQNGINVIIH